MLRGTACIRSAPLTPVDECRRYSGCVKRHVSYTQIPGMVSHSKHNPPVHPLHPPNVLSFMACHSHATPRTQQFPTTHHGHLLRLIEFNDDYAEYFSTGDGGGGGNTIDVAGDEITEILNIIRIDA